MDLSELMVPANPLFKILSGQLEPSKGDVTMSPGERLSVLEQDHLNMMNIMFLIL